MEVNLAAMIELWKKIITKHGTTSQLLCRGPCFLFYFGYYSGTGASGVVRAHNGGDVSGSMEAVLYRSSDGDQKFDPPHPQFFDKGLFIYTVSTDVRWSCQFMRISELPSLDAGGP